jgi:hypothetical protein
MKQISEQTKHHPNKTNMHEIKINENGEDKIVGEQGYVEYLIRLAIGAEIDFDESNDAELAPAVKQGLDAYMNGTHIGDCSYEVSTAIDNAITNYIDMIVDDRKEYSNLKFSPSIIAVLMAAHLDVIKDRSDENITDIIQQYMEASSILIDDDDDEEED